jgi:hypothetical protein
MPVSDAGPRPGVHGDLDGWPGSNPHLNNRPQKPLTI